MSDNNIENWEKELQGKFSGYQEPTDASDFNAFMDKLDESNFFEGKGGYRGATTTWTVIGALLLVGIILWLMNDNSQEEKVQSTQSNKKIIENTINQSVPNTEVEQLTPEDEKDELVKDIESPDELLTIQQPESKEFDNADVTDRGNEEIKESLQLMNEKPVMELKQENDKDTVNTELASKEIIDTITTIIKEEPKKVRKPKKHIVIMATDTTVVTDTSHVKHRKKNRRRK